MAYDLSMEGWVQVGDCPTHTTLSRVSDVSQLHHLEFDQHNIHVGLKAGLKNMQFFP